ncbi:MAG TPA: hypothetical protein VKQ34_03775 [Candidatus Saccharimonadales bacterium]|nr:hypothetical protein [Candidatus Saccharimonadales bacterium]
MELRPATSATPMLAHRAEFERILSNYRINDQALAVLRKTPFVLLVSATAGGRNTVITHLAQTGSYYYIVSDTTRPKRVKDGAEIERDGVEYFFRKEDDVLQDLKDGKFVEAAIIHNQQVSGVSIREVERAQTSGKIAITDIEVQGCETIERLKPDVLNIFVLPPSFEEWLKRIHKRSNLTDEEVKNRLETAVQEYAVALRDKRFIFVINDKLEETVQTVDRIARLGERNDAAEQAARDLAAHLRKEALAYLARYPNW